MDTDTAAPFVCWAETTTVRSVGASVVFGDLTGIVFGEAGTALAFKNEGGRAVVFWGGCDMTLDNVTSVHRVEFLARPMCWFVPFV